LAFLFEEINALKKKLKLKNTAISKKRKAESILFNEINLKTSRDEGENRSTGLLLLNPLALTKLSYQNHFTQQPTT
jgi:hypothetical protein